MSNIMIAIPNHLSKATSLSPGSRSPEISYDIVDHEPKQNEIKLPRPTGNKAQPTQVYPWFEITLQSVDLPLQTFTVSIEMHIFWIDVNLPSECPEYNTKEFTVHPDYVPIKMSEIFENKINCVNSEPEFKYYQSTGVVHMFMVVECTFAERMELHRFPLDRQFLNMDFNGLTKSNQDGEGDWYWVIDFPNWLDNTQEIERNNKPNQFGKNTTNIFDKNFAVRMLSSITEYKLLSPWADFSGNNNQPFVIELRVNRKPRFYFGNIVFPNFLIVAGSFGAFVIERENVADRLSVTVTLMLAAVAFRFVVSEFLPKISYLTFMDYYLLIGFVSLVFLILENALAGSKRLTAYQGKMLDDLCFYIFGATWIILHIITLLAALNKNFLRVSWENMHILDNETDREAEFRYGIKEEGHYHSCAKLTTVIDNNYSGEEEKCDIEKDGIEIKYEQTEDTVINIDAYKRAKQFRKDNDLPLYRKRTISVVKKHNVSRKKNEKKNEIKINNQKVNGNDNEANDTLKINVHPINEHMDDNVNTNFQD